MLRNFKDLKVWQKSYKLCLEIYKVTKIFPKEETYGLTSQIRRSAVSVACNIAEGYGRNTTREYLRSLYSSYDGFRIKSEKKRSEYNCNQALVFRKS